MYTTLSYYQNKKKANVHFFLISAVINVYSIFKMPIIKIVYNI